MTTSRTTLFGHPTGLFTLFFAEMWERFSYYGMRALLLFYMMKGFLGYNDDKAYGVYGAYTALVYLTPYFGGMLADKVLGPRRAVVVGGLLMGAGHLLMTVENKYAFFVALALLICGNGFFKPNISTIVGSLYPRTSEKKDAGFTIFYMGINLGAAMSPVLCGYIGETYGWHYGFGLATAGMLIGVAVFVAPTRLTQLLIGGGALGVSVAMPFLQDTIVQLVVRIFLAGALAIAGLTAVVALGRGGLPKEAGLPRDPTAAARKLGDVVRADVLVAVGTILAVPLIALILQEKLVTQWTLYITGGLALLYLLYEAIRSKRVERHRLFVVLILMFFSMLFWAFFEQAGSSVNNFTDRNVDRVFQARTVTTDEIGDSLRFRVQPAPKEAELAELPLLGQEQLGRTNGDATFTMTDLTKLRDAAGKEEATPEQKVYTWAVSEDDVGMGVGGAEIPASEYQTTNPIFILLLGPVLSGLWGFLGRRRLEPSTPFKFALGLLQLGLGFGVMWYGVQNADARGMTVMTWLVLGYLLHTTGELCLSPVGLSMITKLSPPRMVSTTMGAWFLATAFSNYLASVIAKLTGVSGEEGEEQLIPAPKETVNLYGDVFGNIAIAGLVAAGICFVLVPLLKKWMHTDVVDEEVPASAKAPSSAKEPAGEASEEAG